MHKVKAGIWWSSKKENISVWLYLNPAMSHNKNLIYSRNCVLGFAGKSCWFRRSNGSHGNTGRALGARLCHHAGLLGWGGQDEGHNNPGRVAQNWVSWCTQNPSEWQTEKKKRCWFSRWWEWRRIFSEMLRFVVW